MSLAPGGSNVDVLRDFGRSPKDGLVIADNFRELRGVPRFDPFPVILATGPARAGDDEEAGVVVAVEEVEVSLAAAGIVVVLAGAGVTVLVTVSGAAFIFGRIFASEFSSLITSTTTGNDVVEFSTL